MRGMYICSCNAVTDRDIHREAANGVQTFAQLQQRTGCSDCCGCCENEARATFAAAVEQTRSTLPGACAATD